MHECDHSDKIDAINDRLNTGDHAFSDLHRDIKDIALDVSDIKDQTFKTNGRVTKLERLKTNIIYLIIGVAVCSADGPSIFKAIMAVLK
jgi:hypothetical protein